MKATFFERLGAYLIDTIIISLIFSLICLGLGDNKTNSQKEMEKLDEQFMNGEITNEVYLSEYPKVYYDYQKENVLQLGISVSLMFVYFIIFQYMNKGQTLGKKLLKIKVVDKDTEKPISIIKGFLRTFIIQSILSGTLGLLLVFLLNREIYFTIYATILTVEIVFIVISAMFILYKKDGRGLHDIIAHTSVIKEK